MVEGLHGKFDHYIDFLNDVGPPSVETAGLSTLSRERLTLLYGRNGRGKTSLLSLLFHGLSAAPNRGHRTALSQVEFSRLMVRFTDGSHVRYSLVSRNSRSMRAEVHVSNVGSAKTAFDRMPDGRLGAAREDEVLHLLSSLDLSPAFLTDSRAFQSDLIDRAISAADERVMLSSSRGRIEDLLALRRDQDLGNALDRVNEYLAALVLAGSQRGSQSADEIYTEVARAIVRNAGERDVPMEMTIPALRARVEATAHEAREYSKYGLLPTFPLEGLLSTLRDATQEAGPTLESVLAPYLDSVDRRMQALGDGLHAIAAYQQTIALFLEDKHVRYDLGRGTRVLEADGSTPLHPALLSSGEKQILLMFANLTAMRDTSRLFIIDEPELSLNPEWQRVLIPALLNVTSGSSMQIIVASHSIEILAKYRDRVRRLRDQADG